MDGILLESVEGLGHSPFASEPGEVWEHLQIEKDQVSRDLLAQAMVREGHLVGLLESEAAEEYALEFGWRQRQRLEGRLRQLNEAQDRLIEGRYGVCVDCTGKIDGRRLAADAAVQRCLACQTLLESEYALRKESLTHVIH
ncbi:MAG TPA: hypothetical protein VK208_01750 [Pyrinomonadaceae bacterium]|nr:hypothetical protein [Pyrinomonadaceae bacterium]